MRLIIIALLLAGCAGNPGKEATEKFLQLADESKVGRFDKPITKADYIYTVHGWFIKKSDTKVDPGKNRIDYGILFDNRGLKNQYAREYDITAPETFKFLFPAFIEKKGWTVCGKKLGVEETIVRNEAMKELQKTQGQGGDEAAALCLIQSLTTTKEKEQQK